jgi:hypothetical protein
VLGALSGNHALAGSLVAFEQNFDIPLSLQDLVCHKIDPLSLSPQLSQVSLSFLLARSQKTWALCVVWVEMCMLVSTGFNPSL